MRRIALYGDIHGNLTALDAVLADVAAEGVTERYCLGDLVGYGPDPAGVIARVRALGDPVAQGNYDQSIGCHHASPGTDFTSTQELLDGAESYGFTIASVGSDDAAFLRQCPAEIVLDVDGARLLLCHGSPRRVNEIVADDTPPAIIASLIEAAEADVVCCGHTHVPFHRSVPTGQHVVHWVNAGAVGRPRDGDPRAGWVELVLGPREDVLARASADIACRRVGATETWLSTIVHRVPYDVESVVHAMAAAGLPATLASGLRTGLEEHEWEVVMAERAAADATAAASDAGSSRSALLLQTCASDGSTCTCAIDDRTATYEALARIFRGETAEVAVAIRRLRSAMRTCRISRNVDEAALLAAFEGADEAMRSAAGRGEFVDERARLIGGDVGFDPFTSVLSPDESTYISEDPQTCLVVLGLTYRESGFTIPAIGGAERAPGDIATELSFMGHCLRGAAAGDLHAVVRARRFFAEHLTTWAVLFAVVVAREAREPGMRFAGLALDKFLTCEAATFRHSLPDRCSIG